MINTTSLLGISEDDLAQSDLNQYESDDAVADLGLDDYFNPIGGYQEGEGDSRAKPLSLVMIPILCSGKNFRKPEKNYLIDRDFLDQQR